MASTDLQLSERQPILTSSEQVVLSNPVAPSAGPVDSHTTVVRKDVDVVPEDKNQFIRVIRPLLVELIGTALFVLIGIWGACSNGGVIATALSFGLALMVFSASFGHISGVHFNPSVTIGVLIAGEMQAVIAILYVVMQLLGGIAAGGLLRLLLTNHAYGSCKGGATLLANYVTANETVRGQVQYVNESIGIWQGITIELIVTFVLVTVVLMVALDTKAKTGLAPIVIGFTLAVNILAIGAYTGGSLNPARSLGPAIFANQWENHFVYWIGPLVGAIIAGFLYRTVWAHYDRRLFVKRAGTTTSKAVKA